MCLLCETVENKLTITIVIICSRLIFVVLYVCVDGEGMVRCSLSFLLGYQLNQEN